MASSLSLPLTQAQEREDRHDHDDQADEINQSIHVQLRLFSLQVQTQNWQKEKMFLSRVDVLSYALQYRSAPAS
jgi:hypothetical protein